MHAFRWDLTVWIKIESYKFKAVYLYYLNCF
jgi:hypothetical protein